LLPRVSGYVTEIPVHLHDVVEPGELLVQLDTTQYQISARSARASLDNALQQLGVSSAAVQAATAGLAAARAQESIAQIQHDQLERARAALGPGGFENPSVRIILSVLPGKVFQGSMRSLGLGVRSSPTTTRGELPQVSAKTGLLRQPQRFPVLVDLGEGVPRDMLRVGSQANVMAFTGREGILRPLGRLVMRLFAFMSYVR
jgi:multidrug resistance efflux pump